MKLPSGYYLEADARGQVAATGKHVDPMNSSRQALKSGMVLSKLQKKVLKK